MTEMEKKNIAYIALLHVILLFLSFGGIFSKLASSQPFFSFRFCLYYGIMILILFLYAIAWQQIIKHLPLTLAFSNKAVGIVWGIVWGAVFFHEAVTVGKVVGAVLIIVGVVLFSTDGGETRHE